jgi:hypothetical protein
MNGPPRGANVSSDQSSYDLIYRDIILNSGLATLANNVYSFNMQVDNIGKVYKAEMIAATFAFSSAIPNNIKNACMIVNIPQLNGNTARVAGNIKAGNAQQGTNSTQGSIFCQIPDNYTPLALTGLTSNTINLFIGARMFDTVQYYNPPLSKLNRVDISFFDTAGQPVLINETSSTDGVINTFYFTLRVYYFQKRNNTSSFSTSVFNYAASGTIDSIYRPYQS